MAVVPSTVGDLVRGDVLVSNFNDAKNLQGTGSSIVEISPTGQQHVFAVVPKARRMHAVGLTTALAVLGNGDVVVGTLPAPGGKSSKAEQGALTILDSSGKVQAEVIGHPIDGPWDMTAVSSPAAPRCS